MPSSRQSQPEQQAPPVQRLRIRYAKRGRLRFTSHRDFSRAFERAIFRAGIPMAYSSGYNPHPRISYAGAAPTGSASEAEYLEIALAELSQPAEVKAALAEALPDGLDVLDVVEAAGGALSDLLEASHWLIEVAATQSEVDAAVASFLEQAEVPVERMTKKGLRTFDCRSAVVSIVVGESARGAALDVVLRHGVPSVRPDDVLVGLRNVTGFTGGGQALLTRVAQGPLRVDGSIGNPLADSQ